MQVATASAWGFGGRAILLLVNLCATPVLIRLLGPASYGLWTLLLLAVTWASNADLGMGTASTKFGADCYANHDSRGESSVVWTSLGLVAVTTGCVAVALALVARQILTDLLHVDGRLMTAGTVALRVACAVFVLQSIAGIVNTPQVVRLQWRQLTVLRTFVTVLATIAGMATLALAGGGIVTVAVMGLAAALLMVAGNLFLAIRFQPALLQPKFDGAMLRKLLAYGGGLTVAGLAAVPLSTAERFFLAHDYSTTDVAYLAVALNLATVLQVFPEQLTAPFVPGLARLEAAGRFEDLRALYRKGLTGVFLMVTPAMVLLCFIARPFLSLWAGPQYGVHSTSPFLITIAGVWCGCLAWLPVSYLLSSGHTKAIAWVKVAELVPYIAAAWFLTKWFGVIGAALAWSAVCVLESALLFIVTHRVAGLPWLALPDRSLRSLAGPLVLGGTALLLTYVTSGLAIRLVWAAVLALAYGAATWWLILTRRERRGLTALARNVLRRGKPRPILARDVRNSPASTRAPRHARAYTPRHARVLPRWQAPITRNRLLRDCTQIQTVG